MPIEYVGHNLELVYHLLDLLYTITYIFELGTLKASFWVIKMIMPGWMISVVRIVCDPASYVAVPIYCLYPQIAHLKLSCGHGKLVFVSHDLLEYPVKLL
jgi:hypothetical protein